jgi:predicted ATPase
LENLKLFYNDVEEYQVKLHDGTAQLFFREENLSSAIPATRLSDGTLRYLFLLCVLLHPTPPPLICIEEPELGLHPDILPTLGRLLVDAAERCQIVVTTHSSALIDSLSNHPEYVIVSDKTDKGTEFTRLSKEDLDPWLEDYNLGDLWVRGKLGGTIW